MHCFVYKAAPPPPPPPICTEYVLVYVQYVILCTVVPLVNEEILGPDIRNCMNTEK